MAAALAPDERAELAVIRGIRKVMDDAVALPNTNIKIGLDSVLGLIPGVGDLGSAAVGAYVLSAANKLGVPTIVMVRMLFNLAVDAAVGMIPLVGDVFDVLYRANAKNVALVERAVLDRTTTARASWWRMAGVFAVFGAVVVGGLVGTVAVAKWLWGVL